MDVKQKGRQQSTFRHLRCVYRGKLASTMTNCETKYLDEEVMGLTMVPIIGNY